MKPPSRLHRAAILASDICGCYHCERTFPPSAIEDWVDDGQTALCPTCGIDAVVPDPTPEQLAQWHRRGFGVVHP